MNIFYHDNYKKYVNSRIKQMPKKGRGQYLRMANFLAMNSVNVSQVFKGERDLTAEQARELCDYFGFSPLEAKYFMALVEYEKAGTHKLKLTLQNELQDLREKAQELKHRIKQETKLNEETKAIFYSQWYYSGARLLSSIDGYNTTDKIAEYFKIPVAKMNNIITFLIQNGLCVEENGKIKMGPRSTHIEASHPLVSRHHINWRMKGMSKMENITDSELFLTLPCSLSQKGVAEIRRELVNTIENITDVIDEGKEETLACLNIDWFKF